MALHKLWLSQKPKRDRTKRPKDERQGNVLLDATRHFLADTYPLSVDFVVELPGELREIFNDWAVNRGSTRVRWVKTGAAPARLNTATALRSYR